MLALEEILSELSGGDVNEQGMPPGFRFHPTDEELITFYLASKVFNGTFCGIHIAEVDLNRCEPWELPDVAKMGEREWYFFSLRDRKYPTGLRTNRATGAGYWKATGKDREVYSSSSTASNGNHAATLLGMKKTLVFYKGRAPRGEKTKWVMHEYRLDGDFSCRHTCKEEWVICRIFQKMGEKKNGVLLQGQRSHMQEVPNSFLSDQTNPCSKTGDLEIPPHKTIQSPHNQNQLMNHMLPESNIKSLINNLWSSSQPTATVAVSQANFQTNNAVLNNGSHQTSFSPTRNKEKEDTNHHHQQQQQMQSHSSFLLNTLLSHDQDYYHTTSLKEQEASHPKICKTEDSNFSHFKFSLSDHPVSDYDMRMIPQNLTTTSSYYQQKPLFFGNLDCSNVNRRNVMGNSGGGGGFTATDYEISSSASSSSGVVAAFNRPGFKQMLLDPPTKITAGESWPFPF